MRVPAWQSLWALLATTGSGALAHDVRHGHDHDAGKLRIPVPLATITPCPVAPSHLAPSPITVTEQYQAVSTCEAQQVCMKWGRCNTHFVYRSYLYVSTLIPCLAGSSTTTITRTEQSVAVSRSSSTITRTQLIPRVRFSSTTTSTQTMCTTIRKEWSAEYQDIGPLALPNYQGSNLCRSCRGPAGEEHQVLTALECIARPRQPTVCIKAVETWIYDPAPTSVKAISVVCSSRTYMPTPGVYSLAFPQWAPPATITVSARTITYTAGEQRPRIVTTAIPETVTTVPGYKWTAWITRSCARPTTLEIDVTITETITYTVPPFTVPGSRYTFSPLYPYSSIHVLSILVSSSQLLPPLNHSPFDLNFIAF